MSAIGSPGFPDRIIGEKVGLTLGAIQTADQVIGTVPIPAGSLNVGDCFRVLMGYGRDNNTDAYGASSNLRMGVLGTVADSTIGAGNLSSTFPAASGALSTGLESWWRVVSIGTNSVIEKLGSGNLGPSWAGIGTSLPLAPQITLTGYNLTTQAGFLTFTTTMATAVSTRPSTGYMRVEADM